MDVLTVVTDIVVILSVTVPVTIWAWRKVAKVVADQKREREQTIVAVAEIAKKLDMLERSLIYQRDRRVQGLADELVEAKARNERIDTVQSALEALEKTVLSVQTAQVRSETDQQQVLEKLRKEVAQLQERVEKVASGFLRRP